MNLRKLALTVAAIAIAPSAMAIEATQYAQPANRLSRAQVKEEVRKAAANGELAMRGEAYDDMHWPQASRSTLPRADVRQDVARARAAGKLVPAGEIYDGTQWAQAPRSILTRTEVLQELARAQAAGELISAGETYGNDQALQRRTQAKPSAAPRPQQAGTKAPAAKAGAF